MVVGPYLCRERVGGSTTVVLMLRADGRVFNSCVTGEVGREGIRWFCCYRVWVGWSSIVMFVSRVGRRILQ